MQSTLIIVSVFLTVLIFMVCASLFKTYRSKPFTLHNVYNDFLATYRISLRAVCEQSTFHGLHDDFHDYPDSIEGFPDHMVALTCKRCGKQFYI